MVSHIGGCEGKDQGVTLVVCPLIRWCYVEGACIVPGFCSQHHVFAPGSSKVPVGFFDHFISFASRSLQAVIFSPI